MRDGSGTEDAGALSLPVLQSARICLRQLDRGDLPGLLQLFGDATVVRFMGIGQLHSPADAEALLQSIDQGRHRGDLLQWGLVESASERLVGTCTLSSIDRANERAEVGFALSPSARGRGLMTDALRLLLQHAFDCMRLHRIEADVDPRNLPSLALLLRLGFQREGFARGRHLIAGERQDSVLLGLLAEDWMEQQDVALLRPSA